MLPLAAYNFVFTTQEMQIIVTALQDAPYKVAAPVLNHMQQQIDQQEHAAVEAANPPQPASLSRPAPVMKPETSGEANSDETELA